MTHGALFLRDSRIRYEDNDKFIDILEDYFDRPSVEILKDERVELSNQAGITPANTNTPKCAIEKPCLKIIEKLEPSGTKFIMFSLYLCRG